MCYYRLQINWVSLTKEKFRARPVLHTRADVFAVDSSAQCRAYCFLLWPELFRVGPLNLRQDEPLYPRTHRQAVVRLIDTFQATFLVLGKNKIKIGYEISLTASVV
jgi:hypothetical protein